MTDIPSYFKFDPATRRLSLDARDPAFYRKPNLAYAAMHATSPTFFWEQENHWYFTAYDQVNSVLRDRRFGRQITHVMSREELGWPEPSPHLADFDRSESKSLLSIEPPEHTRLRTLVNRAFVSRNIERLQPEIAALSHRLIDGFEKDGGTELLSSFAETIPVTVIARMIGVPDEKWGEAVKACVVLKPGATLTEAELIAHARHHIAGYKCPKSVDFIEALPRNASGKVLRRELRAPYWEGLDRAVN